MTPLQSSAVPGSGRARRLPAAVLAAGLLVAGVLACRSPPAPTMDLETYVPLRPPVLGYQLLRHPQDEDSCALIRVGAPEPPLCSGDLAACEAELVARLESEFGDESRTNLPLPTLGGLQVWGDRFWYAGWRIQENALTGHCRLLDPRRTRRAWGSREACRAAFEAERLRLGLRQPSARLVILLHGLFRTHGSLSKLERRLAERGYAVAALAYPSTRRSIAEHADALVELLDALEDIQSVSLVTHSLGGLVARAALAREAPWRERIELARLVMLGPPNHGSALAQGLAEYLPFQWLAGPSGLQVAEREAAGIPLPRCTFGVIAGGRGDGQGWNRWIAGDDDGVVGVEEARLEGAADFLVVESLHSFLMNDERAIEAVLAFLEHGRFGAPPE